jgi:hypothetical protein
MTVSVISDDRDFLVSYLCAVIKYYILRIALTPVAYVSFTSFLIHHPDDWFPTLISPPWVTTIHSFHTTTVLATHLKEQQLLPPPHRIWLKGLVYADRVRSIAFPLHATIVDGKLSGPLLRQGIFFIQEDSVIFIGEELGRCPTRDDYLVVIAVRFNNRNPYQYSTFPLYVPIKLIEPPPKQGNEGWPVAWHSRVQWCPLEFPITIVELSRTQRRLRLERPLAPSPPAANPSTSSLSVKSLLTESPTLPTLVNLFTEESTV